MAASYLPTTFLIHSHCMNKNKTGLASQVNNKVNHNKRQAKYL